MLNDSEKYFLLKKKWNILNVYVCVDIHTVNLIEKVLGGGDAAECELWF